MPHRRVKRRDLQECLTLISTDGGGLARVPEGSLGFHERSACVTSVLDFEAVRDGEERYLSAFMKSSMVERYQVGGGVWRMEGRSRRCFLKML